MDDTASDGHQPRHQQDRRDDVQPPGPTSYEKKQKDIGASLFLGGLVIVVLLAVLIWQGLF